MEARGRNVRVDPEGVEVGFGSVEATSIDIEVVTVAAAALKLAFNVTLGFGFGLGRIGLATVGVVGPRPRAPLRPLRDGPLRDGSW